MLKQKGVFKTLFDVQLRKEDIFTDKCAWQLMLIIKIDLLAQKLCFSMRTDLEERN